MCDKVKEIMDKDGEALAKYYDEHPEKLLGDEIKIYRDFYSDPNEVLVGYKGRTICPSGIVYIPYHKPNIFVRVFSKIYSKIRSIFRKKPKGILLFGDRENIKGVKHDN